MILGMLEEVRGARDVDLSKIGPHGFTHGWVFHGEPGSAEHADAIHQLADGIHRGIGDSLGVAIFTHRAGSSLKQGDLHDAKKHLEMAVSRLKQEMARKPLPGSYVPHGLKRDEKKMLEALSGHISKVDEAIGSHPDEKYIRELEASLGQEQKTPTDAQLRAEMRLNDFKTISEMSDDELAAELTRRRHAKKMTEADLAKAGPKGYIHGWVYVGVGNEDSAAAKARKVSGNVLAHRGGSQASADGHREAARLHRQAAKATEGNEASYHKAMASLHGRVARGTVTNAQAKKEAKAIQSSHFTKRGKVRQRLTSASQKPSARIDRSGVPKEDFAGPHGSFPITDKKSVTSAARLAHHADNPDQVRSRIKRIAQRKFPGMRLPASIAAAKEEKVDIFKVGPHGYVHGWIKVGSDEGDSGSSLHGHEVAGDLGGGKGVVVGTYNHNRHSVTDSGGHEHPVIAVNDREAAGFHHDIASSSLPPDVRHALIAGDAAARAGASRNAPGIRVPRRTSPRPLPSVAEAYGYGYKGYDLDYEMAKQQILIEKMARLGVPLEDDDLL